MTYFADLTPYTYLSRQGTNNEVNIGWLDRSHPFQHGQVPDRVLAEIFLLCKDPVNRTRGWHYCELCPRSDLQPFRAARDGIEIGLGSAEIRVPSGSGVVFACPNLIYHYIRDHSYQPPQEFIDALLNISESRSRQP